MTVAQKKRIVSSDEGCPLSISRQCQLLGLNRASYYRPTKPPEESAENLALMRLIDEEYLRHPFYGSRKMVAYLKRKGFLVNRKRVSRLMRLMGIQSLAPGPKTSQPSKQHKVYPYLLRNLDIVRADQVWCSDLTYIRLPQGFVYLTVVMDWYSRKVLSWELSNTMEEHGCVSVLERAIRLYGKPDIFNTDQGSQYTGASFTGVLKENSIKISMDGKGRAMDNIMVERLWRSVKYEEIYLNEYSSMEELTKALKKYFQFYNTERPHQSFGNKTPDEVYYEGRAMNIAA